MENLLISVSNKSLSTGRSEVQITTRSFLLPQLIVKNKVKANISILPERNAIVSILLIVQLDALKNVDNLKKYT